MIEIFFTTQLKYKSEIEERYIKLNKSSHPIYMVKS